MLTLIAHLHARPAMREDLLKVLHSFVTPTREEADCIAYHLHADADDPNHFVFYEVWTSRESLEKHLAMPHLSSFWERRLDYLETDVQLVSLEMLSAFEADAQ